MNLPSASVYSTRPRVSVYGTGAARVGCLAGFLGSLVTSAIAAPRRGRRTLGFRLGNRICLASSAPTAFNALFRQRAGVPLLRHRVAPCGSHGMLTVSAIGLASRLILRARLTQGRLTLPWKPWPCGGGESHTPYRYLYLHLLFQALQRTSPVRIRRTWNAPLPTLACPAASAADFTPDYYPRAPPRPVSCYALFE